jgi:hypothetical protein
VERAHGADRRRRDGETQLLRIFTTPTLADSLASMLVWLIEVKMVDPKELLS